jgi:NAD(P)H-dependent flavin oxidoreductase YrpB (nitropropane dioxygenase family)
VVHWTEKVSRGSESLLLGGISDGRGIAAALACGANGVVMGTRFLASTEVELPAEAYRPY